MDYEAFFTQTHVSTLLMAIRGAARALPSADCNLRGIYRVFSNVPVLPGADLLGPLGSSFFLLSEMDDISPSLALDVGLRNVQDVDYKLPWSVSGSHCPHLMNIDQQHPPRSA